MVEWLVPLLLVPLAVAHHRLRGRRGNVPPPASPRDDNLSESLVRLCEEQQARIAALTEEVGQLRAVIGFPGSMRALERALHPDTASGGDAQARTEIFQTLMAVRDRIARQE